MSIAASELPDLARQRLQGVEVLRARLSAGLRQMAVFVVPSVVGFLVLGDVIVAALYQRGRFLPIDTLITYLVLAGYALGLQASTSTRLLSSAFFALRDTRTPARFAGVRVLIAAGLGFALMWPFERSFSLQGRPLGALGLSLGAGIGAWVEWFLLRRSLHARVGSVSAGSGVMARMYGAALVAALLGRGIEWALPDWDPIIRGLLVLGPFGVTYFLLAHALGIGEASRVLARVTSRLGRKPPG
jgi:putative peptidoglycan lipid II flippase